MEILAEHTFGVRAVAFSNDQRYLATLGCANDGFLYIWSFDNRTGSCKLHSSNRCTANVKGIIWLGSNLITFGTRHIKVWRVEGGVAISPTKQRFLLDGTPQPIPSTPAVRTLGGRNVLLGGLVDATFSCAAIIGDSKVLVCSEKGEICLLDDQQNQQKLTKLCNAGFGVLCVATDLSSRLVRLGGRNGQIKFLDLESSDLEMMPDSPCRASNSDSTVNPIYAMGRIDDKWIEVNSRHAIEVVPSSSSPIESSSDENAWSFQRLEAHSDPVLGVEVLDRPNGYDADFLTYSSSGDVFFWDLQGRKKASLRLALEQANKAGEEDLPLRLVLRASKGAKFIASGDSNGMLRISQEHNPLRFATRAHSADIQDLALHENEARSLVASCSRDRTVQLYRYQDGYLSLIQTIDDHCSSVSGLLFCQEGSMLISCSTDRTVQIRDIVTREVNGQDSIAAVCSRIITLKASPISMATCLDDEGNAAFVVSLLDRNVATYELATGRLISAYRATDHENGDSVVMDSLVMGRLGKIPIMVGASSTDKSVRVYDSKTGVLLDREWGHTASVTGVRLLDDGDQDKLKLISTSSDGTVMIWSLCHRPNEVSDTRDSYSEVDPESPLREVSTMRQQPLRRILSKAELADFQRFAPSTPTGRSSPPDRKVVRRKTSRFNVTNNSPKLAVSTNVPPVPGNHSSHSAHAASRSDETHSLRISPRDRNAPRDRIRSRTPSPVRPRTGRRPSAPTLTLERGRNKSTGNLRERRERSEAGRANTAATESVCRTLRAFRKKLATAETIKEDDLKALDQELRLTSKALSEKLQKTKAITETLLAGLLDQYSDRLVNMIDEKLRSNQLGWGQGLGVGERRPDSAGTMGGSEARGSRPGSKGSDVNSL